MLLVSSLIFIEYHIVGNLMSANLLPVQNYTVFIFCSFPAITKKEQILTKTNFSKLFNGGNQRLYLFEAFEQPPFCFDLGN